MSHIQTVAGPIEPEALGITYMHEHILCDQRRCRQEGLQRPRSAEGLMVLDDVAVAVEELTDIRVLGADAIVEVTMQAWGRDRTSLRRISEATGLKIMATSGFYVELCHPMIIADQSIDELADGLVTEITEGADGTGIRTGLLKVAVSRPVVEGPEKKCARAVARAARRTGAAITTHTSGAIRFGITGGWDTPTSSVASSQCCARLESVTRRCAGCWSRTRDGRCPSRRADPWNGNCKRSGPTWRRVTSGTWRGCRRGSSSPACR